MQAFDNKLSDQVTAFPKCGVDVYISSPGINRGFESGDSRRKVNSKFNGGGQQCPPHTYTLVRVFGYIYR